MLQEELKGGESQWGTGSLCFLQQGVVGVSSILSTAQTGVSGWPQGKKTEVVQVLFLGVRGLEG
jgi:hypothetical protein